MTYSLQPSWGPDHATQRATGTSARVWITDRCNWLAATGHDHDHVDSPLRLLPRVFKPADWTLALLGAIRILIEHYQATGDHTALWSVYNTLLEKGILTGNSAVVRMCLQEPRWRACVENAALVLVLWEAKQASRDIVPLLVADSRFGHEFMLSVVRQTVCQEGDTGDHALLAVLEDPKVSPWVVWQEALRVCARSAILPRIMTVGTSVLVRDAQWAWRRSVAATTSSSWCHCARSLETQVTTIASENPCPKLLTHLPEDVQFTLHLLLDALSVARIRSTCRALASFPIDRFSCQRLHFECWKSATNQDTNEHLNPVRFRALLRNALAQRHHSNATREELVGRVLVECIRHLADVQWSLYLLQQLHLASDPSTAAVYITWCLHTLLNSTRTSAAASTVLAHLLLHPHLPLTAWSLVIHYSAAVDALLSRLDFGPPANCLALPQPAVTTANALLNLARTGTFPEDWSPSPTDFPALFQCTHVHGATTDPDTSSTLILVALTARSANPNTFLSLFSHLSDHPSPTSVLTPAMQRLVVSHALLLALTLRSTAPLMLDDGTLLGPRALLTRADACNYVQWVLTAIQFTSADVMGVLLTLPTASRMSDELRALVDTVYAWMGSPHAVRAAMVEIRPYALAMPMWRLVLLRGLWWWLRMVDAGTHVVQEGERLQIAEWIDRDLQKEKEQSWERRAKARGAAALEPEDLWVTELKNMWVSVRQNVVGRRGKRKGAIVGEVLWALKFGGRENRSRCLVQ